MNGLRYQAGIWYLSCKKEKKNALTENHLPHCIICFVKSSKSYCHQLETKQTQLMQSMLGMRKCFCFLKQALRRSTCLACHSISGFKCFLFWFCNIFAYVIIKTFNFLLALYLFCWGFFKVTSTRGRSRPISVYSNLQTCKMEWGQCRDCFS